jgi:phosphoglycolate phosphatase
MRCARRDLPEASYLSLRPFASAGARGLIGAGFGIKPEDSEFEAMRTEFLDQYESAIAVHSKLFEHVPALLHGLDSLKLPWGIVTNKAKRFTRPLVPLLDLEQARCVSAATPRHTPNHIRHLYSKQQDS